MTSYKPLTLAERWHCSAEHVLTLIHSGRLAAFSLSKPGSKRPRYRISAEAVAAYESGQQPASKVTTKQPQRRKLPKVTAFYS